MPTERFIHSRPQNGALQGTDGAWPLSINFRQTLAFKPAKFIVHIDMDAFFAAIEQLDKPQLCGKPVIVGADPKKGKGRGVVSTCSYEARKYGIHSAMPISLAYRLSPNAIYLPVDIEKYKRVSQKIYQILYDFTPDIEPVSIDEAFLDITGTYHLFETPYNACVLMKARIKKETGLTASVGLAPTKMAAKIASDLKKPDGLVEVKQEELLDFLWPLDVGKLWGIGKKGKESFSQIGIKTIGELARCDVREIIKLFGKNGAYFWRLANGIDKSEVMAKGEAKSISNEITFEKDTFDKEKIEGALSMLCEKVSRRLRQEGLKCKTITLKLRLKGFQTYSRSITISEPTNFVDILNQQIKWLYENFEFKDKLVRLVGVRASGLMVANREDSLFKHSLDTKQEELHKAVDKIRAKFGESSIRRARSMINEH